MIEEQYMKYNRYCCVGPCGKSSKREKLYKFPKSPFLARLWMKILPRHCPSLRNKNKHESYYAWICRRHFEAKYVKPDGRRVFSAIPTLFTESEIAAGVPAKPITLGFKPAISATAEKPKSAAEKIALDHNYSALCWIEGQTNDEPQHEETSYKIRQRLRIDNDKENDGDIYENHLNSHGETADTDEHVVDKRASGFNEQLQNEDYTATDDLTVEDDGVVENSLEARNFTWNRWDAVIPVPDLEDDTQLLSLYCESEKPISTLKEPEFKEDFKCNNCSAEIDGVRYTCVECVDYDLCPPCDARGVHDAHYVLRVPRDKPHWEVRQVVLGLRRRLQRENCDQSPLSIKEEESEVEVPVSPASMETMRLSPLPELDLRLSPELPPEPLDPLMSQELPPEPLDPLMSPETRDDHSDTVTLHLHQTDDLYLVAETQVDHSSVEDSHTPSVEPPTESQSYQHKDFSEYNKEIEVEPTIKENINKKVVISKDTLLKIYPAKNLTKYLSTEMNDEVMYSSDEDCDGYFSSQSTVHRELDYQVEQKRKRYQENMEQSSIMLDVSPKLQPRVVLNAIDQRLYNELLRTGKIKTSAINGT